MRGSQAAPHERKYAIASARQPRDMVASLPQAYPSHQLWGVYQAREAAS